ncbi:hypothetical protein P4O66_011575 [Electrophorus voltai]|uniref:Uncharacterized protein n=1 Tax=Electrophorus voltai TaxID=2609070 RepID=A0AAD9DU08_9TELE|nr:hypothetical protein P4O66_011575 [Electrophorus voltai]
MKDVGSEEDRLDTEHKVRNKYNDGNWCCTKQHRSRVPEGGGLQMRLWARGTAPAGQNRAGGLSVSASSGPLCRAHRCRAVREVM